MGELLGTERGRSAFAPSLSPASRLIGNAWVILTLGTLVSAARRAAAGSRHPWPKSRIRGGGPLKRAVLVGAIT